MRSDNVVREMRNAVVILSLVVAVTLQVSAQTSRNRSFLAYVDRYHDLAVEQMLRYNIPASITLAQGLLESNAGNSELTRKGNNHFGIKCHDWQGAKTYHDDDARNECFRAYNNAYESYEDHSRFLSGSKRYRSLFTLKRTDYKGWARGLKACGYATNPAYAKQLIEIIELYDLHKYDKAKKYDKHIVERLRKGSSVGGAMLAHTVYKNNKNYYVRARHGDTFRSIGKEMGVNSYHLAAFNERSRKDELEEGEIIYLEKKRRRAAKEYKYHRHTVKAGESMYTIAQTYGIRLKSLYKMNGLEPGYQITVGDKLRVR